MNDGVVTENVLEQSQAMERLKVRDYLQILVVTILVALMLKACVIEAFHIPTGSMESTLKAGDFLLVNKFIYGPRTPSTVPFTAISLPMMRLPGLTAPRRGDVLVFELPPYAREAHGGENRHYVKRCIALPGDTVLIRNRRVYVNGEELVVPTARWGDRPLLPQGYGDPRVFPKGSEFNEDQYGPVVLPQQGETVRISHETFFLYKDLIADEGHDIGLDSAGTFVIDGEPRQSYTIARNYYFVMGDNRDNSLDSRFWGFVPEEAIIGKAMLIYWSLDENRMGTGNLFRRIRWERIGTVIR